MFKNRRKEFVRFIQAAKEGNLEEVKEVAVKGRVDFVNRADEQEWTALSWATFNGHFELLKYLVDVMSADVNQKDMQGRTPLYLSCGWGGDDGDSGELTRYLLDHGADYSITTTDGWSPLYLTAFRGKTAPASHLLAAGADLLACDDKGRSPLDIAKATKHQKLVSMLREAAVDRMFEATREGKSSVLQTLVEQYSLDVNQRDGEEKTPLHVAMECGNEGAVKILVHAGADQDLKDGEGRTPKQVALACGKKGAIKALAAEIQEREEQRKSRIILEKERLMLLRRRKEEADAAEEQPSGTEDSQRQDASEGVRGVESFEATSYAVKILAKITNGVTWKDLDQLLELLDIEDDIEVDEPDMKDLLRWSVWESSSDEEGESDKVVDGMDVPRAVVEEADEVTVPCDGEEEDEDDEYDESGGEEASSW